MSLTTGKIEKVENSQTFTHILTGEIRTYLMTNFQPTHKLEDGNRILLTNIEVENTNSKELQGKLVDFLLYLNKKKYINNYTFDYLKVSKEYIKKK